MADENDTIDLGELLNKPMSEFKELPNLPGGKSFYGKLLSIEATHSKNKGTPAFHFGVRLTDPGPDVPASALSALADAGFSLADFTCGADFWLTPKSMVMLKRFLGTLGFAPTLTVQEALKLDSDYLPTAESQNAIRGLDVVVRTPPADDKGRVFTNNINSEGMIAGRTM